MSRAPAAARHVFIVAGEESGDRLGAPLMQALQQATGVAVRFSGVGGAQMAGQGLQSLFPLGDLAIMGFAAIPAGLPKILKRIRHTADAVIAAKPDVLVIIDSPEFTHRVARRVRAPAPEIPIVDYVCPSVWAWRPGRARAMRGYVDHVLALLPFEPAAMRRLGGPPCTFVGHPLSERVGAMRPNAEEARRRLADPPLLLVLPGSRAGEIRRMAGVFGQAVALLAQRIGKLDVVVPAVPRLAAMVQEAVKSWPVPVRVVSEPADKGRRLPQRAGGADQVRHLDAGTGGRRHPHGGRLSRFAAGGDGRPNADHRAERAAAQFDPGRKGGAGIPAMALQPRAAGRGAAAAAVRHAGAGAPACGFRPA